MIVGVQGVASLHAQDKYVTEYQASSRRFAEHQGKLIQIGMSFEEIQFLWGPPDDIGSGQFSKNIQTTVWYYQTDRGTCVLSLARIGQPKRWRVVFIRLYSGF